MSKTIEMIIDEVNAFNESIREVLNAKKINASGEASKSLRVQHDYTSVQSLGIFYLEFLDTGRGAGKMPPIDKLKEWAIVKFNVDEEEAAEIAYATAVMIARFGTMIFQNNKKGIELDEKVLTLRKAINEKIGETAKADVKQILDKFKKLYKLKM